MLCTYIPYASQCSTLGSILSNLFFKRTSSSIGNDELLWFLLLVLGLGWVTAIPQYQVMHKSLICFSWETLDYK